MMKKHPISYLLIFILVSLSGTLFGQNAPTYEMKFLRAKFEDTTTKSIVVVFAVSAKDNKDFPPVISMRLAYSIGEEGQEKTVNIAKSNISVVLYDKDIKMKAANIYELIKSKMNINDTNNFFILAFHMPYVSKDMFDKMSFTYGLWEKNNQSVRIEKKYEFLVEK